MEKIKQLLSGIGAAITPETILRAFNDLYSRQALSNGALAVGTTTTKFKIGTAVHVLVNGVPVLVAAADGPVLTGYNLTSSQVGGFVVTVDAAGTISALPIDPAATLSGVKFPVVPPSQVVVGIIYINAVNAATFTGGTTLMSATSVTYVNIVGPFAPSNSI